MMRIGGWVAVARMDGGGKSKYLTQRSGRTRVFGARTANVDTWASLYAHPVLLMLMGI